MVLSRKLFTLLRNAGLRIGRSQRRLVTILSIFLSHNLDFADVINGSTDALLVGFEHIEELKAYSHPLTRSNIVRSSIRGVHPRRARSTNVDS